MSVSTVQGFCYTTRDVPTLCHYVCTRTRKPPCITSGPLPLTCSACLVAGAAHGDERGVHDTATRPMTSCVNALAPALSAPPPSPVPLTRCWRLLVGLAHGGEHGVDALPVGRAARAVAPEQHTEGHLVGLQEVA